MLVQQGMLECVTLETLQAIGKPHAFDSLDKLLQRDKDKYLQSQVPDDSCNTSASGVISAWLRPSVALKV